MDWLHVLNIFSYCCRKLHEVPGNALKLSGKVREFVYYRIIGRRGRLYSSCVRSSMLQESETWPVRKENEVALQRAEMRMVRYMCVKVKDRVSSKELTERLGIDDIILILQQNSLRWYGHFVAKRRHWFGEKMYGIWGGGLQSKR